MSDESDSERDPAEGENVAIYPSSDGDFEVHLTGEPVEEVPECPECEVAGEPLPDAESVTEVACMDETCEVGSYLLDGTVLWRE
ncbi:hypothetical protein [Halococcus hamelinensis]|uniref:Uncharacterized protein n=1 Tax=Halococcus hamelinensis 100A6 TaxID=1132509 RepID=M0M9L1_9EURY|nr:hypothetical protein [Halococcus hamelinensis]EMA42003.1 hypothetical protein C447_00395 [Halococcus hamelinensis 100A6]